MSTQSAYKIAGITFTIAYTSIQTMITTIIVKYSMRLLNQDRVQYTLSYFDGILEEDKQSDLNCSLNSMNDKSQGTDLEASNLIR
jgi:hypothetical protein